MRYAILLLVFVSFLSAAPLPFRRLPMHLEPGVYEGTWDGEKVKMEFRGNGHFILTLKNQSGQGQWHKFASWPTFVKIDMPNYHIEINKEGNVFKCETSVWESQPLVPDPCLCGGGVETWQKKSFPVKLKLNRSPWR